MYTTLTRYRFQYSFVNYKRAANDKVYQFLAQGRWFSPGTPASSTTKTGRHDIAEILLQVALNTKIQNSNSIPIKFKDTKGVIRSRKSKKNTKCNAQRDKQLYTWFVLLRIVVYIMTYAYEKHCRFNAGTTSTWYSWHSKYVYYLFNHLKIDNGGRLTTKFDGKRDDFIFLE